MVSAELEPTVTGISPAEGPPGTIVKIRGENLGRSEKDLLGKRIITLLYFAIFLLTTYGYIVNLTN